MTSVACALLLLLLAPQAVGEVETSFDRKADFRAFRTYAWSKGHEAYIPEVHTAIVAAIDAQMAAAGFSKAAPGTADVTLRYDSLRSSDVDLKTFEKLYRDGLDTSASTKTLGRLAVVMSDAKSEARLWTALARRRLSEDPAKRNEDVSLIVASLFEKYPGRKK
jgi:hypothetical protein